MGHALVLQTKELTMVPPKTPVWALHGLVGRRCTMRWGRGGCCLGNRSRAKPLGGRTTMNHVGWLLCFCVCVLCVMVIYNFFSWTNNTHFVKCQYPTNQNGQFLHTHTQKCTAKPPKCQGSCKVLMVWELYRSLDIWVEWVFCSVMSVQKYKNI